ncbi:MAG: hypothetical protein OEY28_07055 [Nitrospira sp.]|nr:hypothetical protein [Nitrospira sp.]
MAAKSTFSAVPSPPAPPFPAVIPVAGVPPFPYNGGMAIDRKKPITGKELEELIERDKEAVASLACEGIHFTPEEEAVFQEMNRLGLSYDEQGKYLDDWLHRTYGIPLPEPE